MRSSKLARRQLRNHARYRGRNDLNIVPMLDVMVILAFFLIFTAVFSKTSILEVHLPGPGAQAAPAVPTNKPAPSTNARTAKTMRFIWFIL